MLTGNEQFYPGDILVMNDYDNLYFIYVPKNGYYKKRAHWWSKPVKVYYNWLEIQGSNRWIPRITPTSDTAILDHYSHLLTYLPRRALIEVQDQGLLFTLPS
jgi:hypothetical protein